MTPPPIPTRPKPKSSDLAKAAVAVLAAAVIFSVIGSIGSDNKAPAPIATSTSEPVKYKTPTGPTTVMASRAIGCTTFEDLLDVATNEFTSLKRDVEGLIKTSRCVVLPLGMSVEIVERPSSPNGKKMNTVCVKPTGSASPACLWTMIQNLYVDAE